MKEALRPLRNFLLGGGLLLIAFGFGQFLLFMGLDALGVVEVGNALGHGLLLWFAVALGLLLLVAGRLAALVNALVTSRR